MTIRLATVLLTILLGTMASMSQQADPEGARRGYEIGPGDKISGRVLGESDFNFDSVVDEDGRIQVPFSDIGIVARCRTEKELRAEVARHLQKYLRNPQLSVNVVERNRPPVIVFGEIASAQRIQLTRTSTLLEVLSFSGGLRPEASGSIQITRTLALACSEPAEDNWRAAGVSGISFPTRTFAFKTLKEINPVVYPGDVIDVGKAPSVYVIGEVVDPGSISIPEEGLSLMRALAMASGTGREAKLKSVKIYRKKEGFAQPETIVVDTTAIKKGAKADPILQPLDIVEVGKARRSVGEVLLELATGGLRTTANNIPMRVMY